ncbi:unnamed protein product [Closterium sp. NIES-65]|nr:unnamed protein product [Closterium sp. NIES-65]
MRARRGIGGARRTAAHEQRRHGAGGTRGPVWRRGLREGRTVQVPIYDLKSSTRVGFREVNAEKYAAEDKEKREAVDVKNQADSMIYQTEKQLKELAEKVPAELGQTVYSQGGAPGADGAAPGAAPGSAAGGNPNDVIDPDFTDSK